MEHKVTRKQLAILAAFVITALGANHIMQVRAPMGRDMSSNRTARDLLQNTSAPSREVSNPTLTLVVFTDFQCPACKLSNPAMEAAVAKDEHVRVVYLDWPIFGSRSERAARVALAADRQGLYPAVHTRLMSEKRPLDEKVLHAAVKQSGGDWSHLQRDLAAHERTIDAELAETVGLVFALGIEGTPAYLVGHLLITGGLDEEEFTEAFALGRKMKGS